MPRGGSRPGAGKKSSWKSGCKFAETKLIRVPERLSAQLLEIAHALDEGKHIEIVTESDLLQGEIVAELCEGQITIPFDEVTKSDNEIDTKPKIELGPLNETKLSERLTTSRSNLRNWKKRWREGRMTSAEFLELIRSKDPHGVAWEYCVEDKKYYPVIE